MYQKTALSDSIFLTSQVFEVIFVHLLVPVGCNASFNKEECMLNLLHHSFVLNA